MRPSRPHAAAPDGIVGVPVWCALVDESKPSSFFSSLVEGHYAEQGSLSWNHLRSVRVKKVRPLVPPAFKNAPAFFLDEGAVYLIFAERCFPTLELARAYIAETIQQRIIDQGGST